MHAHIEESAFQALVVCLYRSTQSNSRVACSAVLMCVCVSCILKHTSFGMLLLTLCTLVSLNTCSTWNQCDRYHVHMCIIIYLYMYVHHVHMYIHVTYMYNTCRLDGQELMENAT